MQYRYSTYKNTIQSILLLTEFAATLLLARFYLDYTLPTAFAIASTVITILYLAGDYQQLESRFWSQDAVMISFRVPIAVIIYCAIFVKIGNIDVNETNVMKAIFVILDVMVILTITRIIFHQTIKNLFSKGVLFNNRLILTFGEELSDELKSMEINQPGSHDTYVNFDLTELRRKEPFTEITQLIEKREIDEIIWATEDPRKDIPPFIIHSAIEKGIPVKQIPGETLIILGLASMYNTNNQLMLQYNRKMMRPWEILLKRLTDITVSIIGLAISLPFLPIIFYAIKSTSKGPLFYTQERVGKNGKTFKIIKFRSMYVDAEKDGPSLSSANDSRITRAGRYMRKWRIDELPQFINVLANHMSLVGPRPERRHFIDILKNDVPHITNYLTVKPGISSLGMVKFGYAENTKEMIRRFKYDLYYIQNQSFVLDLQIMALTIRTIILGRGK